jgi:hypothetical protein
MEQAHAKYYQNFGFQWKNAKDSKTIITERQDIRYQKTVFHQENKEVQGRNEINFLLCWNIYSCYRTCAWCLCIIAQGQARRSALVSKGNRLMTIHVSRESGFFFPNCLLIFKSSAWTVDYHTEMKE